MDISKENTQTALESLVRLAAIIPVLGILLYSLGWNYWSSYFENLKIPLFFISLSIETVIITTWKFTLGSILLTSYALIDFLQKKHRQKFEIAGALLIIYIAFVIGLQRQISTKAFIISAICGFAVFTVYRLIEKRFKIAPTEISKTMYLTIICISIYVFGFFYYSYKGKTEAEKFISSYYENVEITLSDDSKMLGYLITNMQNKYFVLIEKPEDCLKSTIILNEGDIRQINLNVCRQTNLDKSLARVSVHKDKIF